MNEYGIIEFKNGNTELSVNVSPKEDTVWLTKEQIAILFCRDRSVISKHVNNILKERELDDLTCAIFAHVQKEGNREVKRSVEYYNLDMIISIGYRVKSQNGIIFRKWANSILKDYLLKGYVTIEKKNYSKRKESNV